jgi:guanylate kinase
LKAKRHLKRSKGILFIVSGPSGAGKTTLYKKVASNIPNLKPSVSFTTRPARPGEVNDKDYTFISRNEFMVMIDNGEFAEWAEVHGELYGTSSKRLEEIIGSGIDAILDIDTQGARKLRDKYRKGVYIFVLPPSMKVLRERLEKRMANSKEEIKKRLKVALTEIKRYQEYDYVIINNTLKDSVKKLEAIIISHRVSSQKINSEWIERNFLNKSA